MYYLRTIFVSIFVCSVFPGCAYMLQMVAKPQCTYSLTVYPEFNSSKIKTVVIKKFNAATNDYSKDYTLLAADDLARLISERKTFNIMNRELIDTVGLQSAQEAIVKHNIDVTIAGLITDCRVTINTEEGSFTEKNGTYHTTHRAAVFYKFAISYQVADAKTGQVVFTKEIAKSREASDMAFDGNSPKVPSKETVLTELYKEVNTSFLNEIVPHEVTQTITLETANIKDLTAAAASASKKD